VPDNQRISSLLFLKLLVFKKRTDKLIEQVSLYGGLNPAQGGSIIGRTQIKPFHLIRPIPQTQIDRTTNGYTQNPGY
jgi:starch-binding outer membrane protein, SusD/RagB family